MDTDEKNNFWVFSPQRQAELPPHHNDGKCIMEFRQSQISTVLGIAKNIDTQTLSPFDLSQITPHNPKDIYTLPMYYYNQPYVLL